MQRSLWKSCILTTSMGTARYFVTFNDDFSRKVWFYVLESKGDCFEMFMEFKELVETQLKHKIKIFLVKQWWGVCFQGIQPNFKESWY